MGGVTATGFDREELADIEQEIKDEILTTIQGDLNLSSSSLFGQLISIFASKVAEQWEVSEELYRIIDPDSATDNALDIIAALTKTPRLAATKSTATLTVNLDAGTTLAVGRIVSLSTDPTRTFVTTAEVTNGTAGPGNFQVAAEASVTGVITALAGNIDTIDTPQAGWNSVTNGAVQAAVTAGNSETYALTNGWTLTVKVDGGGTQTATFNTGDFSDIANATAAEVFAVLNTDITGQTASDDSGAPKITSDDTGTGGIIEVTGGTANAALGFGIVAVLGYDGLDATAGTAIETDEALRIRREALLTVSGNATVDAIRADVLAVTAVTACDVFENTTLIVDGDGVPGKAFEAVVVGGALNDIAQAIWDSKSAGIEAHGSTSGNATDDTGATQAVAFSRPTDAPMHVDFTVTTNGDYPVDGDAQIKAALKAYGELYTTGDDVIYEAIKAQVFTISGVLDVTLFEIVKNATPGPGDVVNITIGSRELTSWDTSNMTVI